MIRKVLEVVSIGLRIHLNNLIAVEDQSGVHVLLPDHENRALAREVVTIEPRQETGAKVTVDWNSLKRQGIKSPGHLVRRSIVEGIKDVVS